MLPERCAEIAAKITGPCSCHESYKKAEREAPDCAFHNFAEDIARELRTAYLNGVDDGKLSVFPEGR